MTKCVAASVQWAGIEIGELAHVLGGLCTGNLGPTLGVRNLGGHRRISLADTDDRVSEDVLTSSPPPGLLVEAINIFLSKTIGRSNRRAAFAIANSSSGT